MVLCFPAGTEAVSYLMLPKLSLERGDMTLSAEVLVERELIHRQWLNDSPTTNHMETLSRPGACGPLPKDG